MQNPEVIAVALVALACFLAFLFALFGPLRLWIQAKLCGVRISFTDILRIKLRKMPPALIVHAAIALQQRKVPVPIPEIEECYLANVAIVKNATQLATLVLEKRNSAG